MPSEWDLQAGEWKDGTSELGRKVTNFMFQNPEWVVYVRKDRRYLCPTHYSQESGSISVSDPTCTFCYGFGTKVTFELTPCRIERDRGQMAPSEGSQRAAPGYLEMDNGICDFPRDVRPNEEDNILVCEWPVHPRDIRRDPRKRPIRVAEFYTIEKINPHFEREIMLFNTTIRLYTIDKAKADALIQTALTNLSFRRIDGSEWQEGAYW